MNLKGKTVLVTGATGGIASELVSKLSSSGSNMILVSKSKMKLVNLAKRLKGESNKIFECDFNNLEKTESLALQIFKNNKVDILINAAGVGIYKLLEETETQDWLKSFNVGLTSVYLFSREFAKSIHGNDSEKLILNIGSGAGVIPMAKRSLYCSSKFGLRGFTLSLAEEYARINNPRFCLITLGSTLTSFGPMDIEEKIKEMEKGKAYFTVEWVAEKILSIIVDDQRETEYTLYPSDYGFGQWQKPEPK